MGLITQTAKEYYTVANNFTGNGSATTFTVTFDPLPSSENEFIVYQAGNEIDDDQYTYNSSTGVVTFSNGNFTKDGSTITTIDGGNIETNTVGADQIAANSVRASELQISSTSSTAGTMFFDGTNNRIDIKDNSGTLRVRIGQL